MGCQITYDGDDTSTRIELLAAALRRVAGYRGVVDLHGDGPPPVDFSVHVYGVDAAGNVLVRRFDEAHAGAEQPGVGVTFAVPLVEVYELHIY